eukprot:TRINITY_DN69363_c0_g1_i4.p1 TRINITY_DN69363_c0_g1~~TRINITY_DN69363_c0_g1_i4.p1  ORF type:complete len:1006 (+),score=157.78 TRINITY_DN69363_c0_g1_i4:59-3076(+)
MPPEVTAVASSSTGDGAAAAAAEPANVPATPPPLRRSRDEGQSGLCALSPEDKARIGQLIRTLAEERKEKEKYRRRADSQAGKLEELLHERESGRQQEQSLKVRMTRALCLLREYQRELYASRVHESTAAARSASPVDRGTSPRSSEPWARASSPCPQDSLTSGANSGAAAVAGRSPQDEQKSIGGSRRRLLSPPASPSESEGMEMLDSPLTPSAAGCPGPNAVPAAAARVSSSRPRSFESRQDSASSRKRDESPPGARTGRTGALQPPQRALLQRYLHIQQEASSASTPRHSRSPRVEEAASRRQSASSTSPRALSAGIGRSQSPRLLQHESAIGRPDAGPAHSGASRMVPQSAVPLAERVRRSLSPQTSRPPSPRGPVPRAPRPTSVPRSSLAASSAARSGRSMTGAQHQQQQQQPMAPPQAWGLPEPQSRSSAPPQRHGVVPLLGHATAAAASEDRRGQWHSSEELRGRSSASPSALATGPVPLERSWPSAASLRDGSMEQQLPARLGSQQMQLSLQPPCLGHSRRDAASHSGAAASMLPQRLATPAFQPPMLGSPSRYAAAPSDMPELPSFGEPTSPAAGSLRSRNAHEVAREPPPCRLPATPFSLAHDHHGSASPLPQLASPVPVQPAHAQGNVSCSPRRTDSLEQPRSLPGATFHIVRRPESPRPDRLPSFVQSAGSRCNVSPPQPPVSPAMMSPRVRRSDEDASRRTPSSLRQAGYAQDSVRAVVHERSRAARRSQERAQVERQPSAASSGRRRHLSPSRSPSPPRVQTRSPSPSPVPRVASSASPGRSARSSLADGWASNYWAPPVLESYYGASMFEVLDSLESSARPGLAAMPLHATLQPQRRSASSSGASVSGRSDSKVECASNLSRLQEQLTILEDIVYRRSGCAVKDGLHSAPVLPSDAASLASSTLLYLGCDLLRPSGGHAAPKAKTKKKAKPPNATCVNVDANVRIDVPPPVLSPQLGQPSATAPKATELKEIDDVLALLRRRPTSQPADV